MICSGEKLFNSRYWAEDVWGVGDTLPKGQSIEAAALPNKIESALATRDFRLAVTRNGRSSAGKRKRRRPKARCKLSSIRSQPIRIIVWVMEIYV